MTSSLDPSPPLSLPWKTRLAITIITKFTDAMVYRDGTINRRIYNLFDRKAPPNPNPHFSVTSTDITVDSTRNLWFRLYSPITTDHDDKPLPVLIFFHGGGFTFLSADSQAYDVVCRRFAKKLPAYVISVNYRLSPEFKYPAQYDDGFDVLKFLDDPTNRNLLPGNADLSKCFLAGDSAGANLAHHVAVRASRNKFRTVKVLGLVSIQPFFGGEERTESEMRLVNGPLLVSAARTDDRWKAFLPEGADRDHAAVNVSGPNGEDLSGLDFPETVVFVGGFDPLQDWQRRYYEWLKKSGKKASLIEYPNMVHAFYVFTNLPESGKLIGEVKEFVAKKVESRL
ncbi:hypothetical protein ACFE04_017124 [Oxalis oulophora]